VAHALVELREMMIHPGDAVADGLRRLLALAARLRQAGGERFEVVGEGRDLRGRLARGVGYLVGEARQALVQALDRVTGAVIGAAALDALEPVGEADHAAAELVEGLRLFARRDVDLGRRLAHGAVVFGLAALGGFEAARHVAQLLLDAAIDVGAVALALGDAGQHVVGVAARRHGALVHAVAGTVAVGGPLFAGRSHIVRCIGEAAEYPSGHPFSDRQPFAAGRGSRRLARLGRDTRHIPGNIRPHFDSLSTAPANISTGVKM
jgi:hypothetical protein